MISWLEFTDSYSQISEDGVNRQAEKHLEVVTAEKGEEELPKETEAHSATSPLSYM